MFLIFIYPTKEKSMSLSCIKHINKSSIPFLVQCHLTIFITIARTKFIYCTLHYITNNNVAVLFYDGIILYIP